MYNIIFIYNIFIYIYLLLLNLLIFTFHILFLLLLNYIKIVLQTSAYLCQALHAPSQRRPFFDKCRLHRIKDDF